ncbi:hypothetical protein Poli38472_009745 [Pythium oligandrum]|uniref:Uncharacterized protein n=1 Tax=Pythium oligandrum TaxID=41045 RepID=A0A8K1FJX3_PYTOL|nr:hypothetical protein Poli38472_009745 [Pythium oligandrum]|eukprot:TMW62252.1 hypothetical protein Poli38472_009745 [Pythium oligandrum]
MLVLPSTAEKKKENARRRPASSEASPPRKTTRLVEDLLNTKAEMLTLPLLKSPTHQVARDKALLQQMLLDCKTKSPQKEVELASHGSGNQQSGRDRCETDATRIPDVVFFMENSCVGLLSVDLSDWACLCRENSSVLRQIATSLSSNCVELKLRGLTAVSSPKALIELFQHCQNVKQLDLSCFRGIAKAGFAAIARQCPSLEALSLAESDALTDSLLHAIVSALPHLKTLTLNDCHRLTDAGILAAVKKLPHLKRLSVDHCVAISESAMLTVIQAYGARCRTLSVRGLARLTDKVVQALFITQPRGLETLSVSDCTQLSDDGLEFLCTVPSYFGTRVTTAYHQLHHFDLSGCVRLTSLACTWIAASCPFLRTLRLARCIAIFDKGLNALSTLQHLEELDLSGCTRLTDAAMSKFFVAGNTPKPLSNLSLVGCRSFGSLTISAIASSCAKTLQTLDTSDISECAPSVWTTLVKSCRRMETWRCRGQPGITRGVLTHLAGANRVLRILDLRNCINIDDLALYPLLVIRSLQELLLSGNRQITSKGIRSLPSNIKRLELSAMPQLDDEACRVLVERTGNALELLTLSGSSGISSSSIETILRRCRYLRALNVSQCSQITVQSLGRALQADTQRRTQQNEPDRYGVELIDDDDRQFFGIAAVDDEAARNARSREVALQEAQRREAAAISIQVRFRSRARVLWKRQQLEEQQQREYDAAVTIQRIARGFLDRRRYVILRALLRKAAVYLQYRWRRRREQRRVRKAMSYWTNQLVLKMFSRWKDHVLGLKADREHAHRMRRAAKALGFWSTRTLARVFQAWRTFATSRTIKAKKALAFWKCQSLPRVFEAWYQLVRQRSQHKQRLVVVFMQCVELETHNSTRQLEHVAKANRSALRVVIKRWRSFVHDQKLFLLQSSLSLLTGHVLPWAFREWRATARELRLRRDKHRTLLRKMLNHQLYRVWLAWLDFRDAQRAKRRALLRFTASTQTKCFLRWKAAHQANKRLQQVSARVVARFLNRQAVDAIATWYSFTQDAVETRQRQRRALAFLFNTTLIRTFQAWVGYTMFVKNLRARWKARLAQAGLHFTFTQWVDYLRLRRELHCHATRLQAFWRGQLSRRQTEDAYFYRIWATVLIQTAWRQRLARMMLRIIDRKARLREYLRAERERDAMDQEEAHMRAYDHMIEQIIMLQRRWRGVVARQLFREVRRARYILRKQQEIEMQEIIRAEARRKQLEREQLKRAKELAAVEIQRHVRGFLTRQWYKTQQDHLHQTRCALRVQAVYRSRMSRRRTAALRRSYLTRMEVLSRRAVEGKLLRTMGAQTRATQRPLRGLLSFFGLDLATFLLDIRAVFREVHEDFQSLKAFFDVVRTRVQTAQEQQKQHAVENGAAPSSPTKSRWSRQFFKRSESAKKLLADMEMIVNTTANEQEAQAQLVERGDAVRIILRGHPRCGETAFVLSLTEDIAQVKLDVDGALEFFPLMLPAAKMEAAKPVFHKIPSLTFHAAALHNGKINWKWRLELEAYAQRIQDDAKRFNAARLIQCAGRVYLARLRYQQELERQGVHAARRQQALLRVLSTFRAANTRITNILVHLHLVRPSNLPRELDDEPLMIHKIVNRFQRQMLRRQEINQAYLRLVPEPFKGHGAFQGGIMPVSPTRIIDKLIHYPLLWLTKITRLPMARLLEMQGNHELAQFIGGAAFVRTFEERHIDARAHWFDQLVGCRFCAHCEGWAVVHGVFEKRVLSTDRTYTQENRIKRLHQSTKKKVPHGWGVAHFLTGRVGNKQRSWLERDSIEAQFKSLTLVRKMQQEEHEGRVATQILARQGTWNTLRSKEGPRGFAKRHAELSTLEEKTKAFYARFQRELALRIREEVKIFEEEARVNALIAVEKQELETQGRALQELQQLVPDVIAEVRLMTSNKTPLEFLSVGAEIRVEYDDEEWYVCQIQGLDIYDSYTADIWYVEDQRKETIKLVEASVLEAKQFQMNETRKRPKTVAEITADATRRARSTEIPFRKWTAGKAVEIAWDAPLDHGAAVSAYKLEWKDEDGSAIQGESVVTTTQTTLWPIPEHCETTLRVRVAAQNIKGMGLASVYMALPPELTDVSYRTAVPIAPPPRDTAPEEGQEREQMGREDTLSKENQRDLTCTQCQTTLATPAEVDEHVARMHAVPLICPFRSCQQVCASERALRYHIWRATITKPTQEELQSELFMEIFDLSKQYCFRKPRRHGLKGAARRLIAEQKYEGEDDDDAMAVEEEVYLENKYQEARTTWFAAARGIHERLVQEKRRDEAREIASRYTPPSPLYGVDYQDAEVDIARREAVIATIGMLQEDLDAFRLETATKMDQLRHEEKELVEYIALKTKRMKTSEEEWQKQSLKREKKKAQKNLDQVQATLQQLIATSTQRIEEMTTEIERLTVIQKAFIPFTHQVIKLQRLGTVIQATHAKSNAILTQHRVILAHYQEDLRILLVRMIEQVAQLDAWDAMIAARRKQLEALTTELHDLQLQHRAEIESFRLKRDQGDERFDLTKLRQQQAAIWKRREEEEQALLALARGKKPTRGELARSKAAAQAQPIEAMLFAEIAMKRRSLHIANHDLQMHEKFIKGKSADVEYLKDDEPAIEEKAGEASQPAGEASVQEAVLAEAKQDEEDDVAALLAPKKKTKKMKRVLEELPHSYVRLECEFVDGRIHGDVRIEYNDGSVYEGPWVEDVSYDKPVDLEPHKTRHIGKHWGKFTYHDGTVWEGEDVDNYFSPFTATGQQFQVTTPQGHQYRGQVRMGLYHGFGTLSMQYTFSKGEYIGEWCEGKRQGYGIERFDNGELYEGYWALDVYHGHGEIVYDDGSRFDGMFRYGKWQGDGVRTLASGDRILGIFTEGFLNGPGVMEFADKRHYVGEFLHTRRHGFGALAFPNGDRYEGPFHHDEMHGEGRFITKAPEGSGTTEPLVRLGKWVHGERVAWLSKASTQLATSTFIQYFGVLENVSGEIELNLLPPRFKTPYAVMVASQLPTLPEGVDSSDPFVQSIVRMLAKTQNVVVGAGLLEKTANELATTQQALGGLQGECEEIRNDVERAERECRAQQRAVNDLEAELDDKTAKEQEMQVKVETFWKKDTYGHEKKYKLAVDELHACEVMDWYKLRRASLDNVYMSLLEAFATLLHFTTNFYLNDKPYKPTREDIMMLLSSNEENVHLGDKEGLIHRYDVKALYVLPLFDVYSFAEGTRNQMLHGITSVIHHPRLGPNNFRLHQISPAFVAVCHWVRAAFFYAKKAIEIAPVVQRVMNQLIVLEHLKTTLDTERKTLTQRQQEAHEARTRLEEKRHDVDEVEHQVKALQKVMTDIEALDKAEHTPLTKAHIKKPQSYRPASAGLPPPPCDDEEEDEENEESKAAKAEREKKKAEEAAAAAQVNRRQVFEEDHAEGTDAKQTQRLKKEQVLAQILTNEELAQDFELLKKEVKKVLDRSGGKVPVDEFPQRFEEVMLKALDPMHFGIKKMRTLLLLMEDVCTIVEPMKEGEIETVQFPIEPDDEPMLPRQPFFCRLCPGMSFATPSELSYHERTKWHYWNLLAKQEGRPPTKYTIAANYWSEAYDSSDNTICYYNKMTGEVVKSEDPPMEMQANDLVLELLSDAPLETMEQQETETQDALADSESQLQDADPWEEVADEAGDVYFYNRLTGESSWTRPEEDQANDEPAGNGRLDSTG